MTEDELKDVCPACGVPAKAFEPYKSRVSEEREKMLSLHMHPIMVHFPQAFVVLALFFDILALFVRGDLYPTIVAGIQINTVFLPLGVIASIAVGLYDGKLRFKSVKTPVLKIKMKLGILYTVLSVIAAIIVLTMPLTTGVILVLIVLTFASMILAIVLGKMGSRLMNAAMGGK